MSRRVIKAAIERLRHFTEWVWSAGNLMEDIRTLLEIYDTSLARRREQPSAAPQNPRSYDPPGKAARPPRGVDSPGRAGA